MTVSPRATTPALLQVDAVVARLRGREALGEVCRVLRAAFPHYRWVGGYRRDGDELVLEAWNGPAATEHTRFPIDRGLCGRAVRDNRTVFVDDVRSSSVYLACFLVSRSEVVVPNRDAGRVVGEIVIDGDRVGAYDASDGAFLEQVASKLIRSGNESGGERPPA